MDDYPAPQRLYTIAALAKDWSLSESYVAGLVSKGALPAVHFGRAVRIRAADAAVFIEARRTAPAQ